MKELDPDIQGKMTEREVRFHFIVADMVENGGFTEEQAAWLLNYLSNYLPVV